MADSALAPRYYGGSQSASKSIVPASSSSQGVTSSTSSSTPSGLSSSALSSVLPSFSTTSHASPASHAATTSSHPASRSSRASLGVPRRHSSYVAGYHSHSSSGAAPTNHFPQAAHHPDRSLSTGGLAAAIVFPILITVVLAVAALCWCRRRRRRRARPESSRTARAMGENETRATTEPTVTATTPMVETTTIPLPADEKNGDGSLHGLITGLYVEQPRGPAVHVVTSQRNDTYFSGLDTATESGSPVQESFNDDPARRSDGGTFVDPPPPYRPNALSVSGSIRASSHGSGADAPRRRASKEAFPSATLVGQRGHARPSPNTFATADFSDVANMVPLIAFDSAPPSHQQDFYSPQQPRPNSLENDYLSYTTNPQRLRHPRHLHTPSTTFARPSTATTTSNASITSTLYSDSASVRSAQAAAPMRGSVFSHNGDEQMRGRRRAESNVRHERQTGSEEEYYHRSRRSWENDGELRDPFADPSPPGTPRSGLGSLGSGTTF